MALLSDLPPAFTSGNCASGGWNGEGDGGWLPPTEAESRAEAESSLERDGKTGEAGNLGDFHIHSY